MKQSQFYKLQDLIEQIKGVENMIQLHSDDPTGFMLNQYKATKEKLVRNLIDQLISPALISTRSIHTIKMVIDKYYGEEMKKYEQQNFGDDLSKLEFSLAS